jgi:hypothetical protein
MRPGYPDLGLAATREETLRVKALLRQGIDSIEAERARKAQAEAAARNTFSALAEDWLAARRSGWSARYAREVEQRLASDILPALGAWPITNITALDIRELLHAIAARSAGNLAIKVRVICSGIIQHALALGLCESDPAHMARRVIARPAGTPHPAALSKGDARARLVAEETCAPAAGADRGAGGRAMRRALGRDGGPRRGGANLDHPG